MTLAAVLCCAIAVSAQDTQTDRNKTYRITLGNVQYTHHNEKMSAGDAVITNINAKSDSRTWKDKDGKTQVTTSYTGIVEALLSAGEGDAIGL